MGSSSTENFNENIFLSKICLQKKDLTYTYYLNLVEAIIRHQKFCLTTCPKLRSSGKCYLLSLLTGKNVSWKIRRMP